ncbi:MULTISPECIES: hypothetical protein [unclassified Pedobacter]|uniref:hypothetical protein n=1 Tax=unclassified Pedobacter TaxID=2628915 RepID=UPI00142094AE|nr:MULTISPECIES: hypothetical protein [unclassified Pedobacter]NII81659.1 hypothetical protein [Pedobacter sp. SG908]NMN35663.1 hypothetical protein [Pedobacter sp. SG918]
MKKFLKITAAIVLLLLIFFAGVIKYRRYQSERTLIPKNVTGIVKINVDELGRTLASNMLSNLGYYFKSDLKNDTTNLNSPDKFNNGLKIPASIYFYTIERKPQIYFSRFEIENINDFENSLRHLMHLDIIKRTEGTNIARSKLGNVVIYYNSKSAAVSLSVKAENLDDPLMDILNQKNFIKINDSKFKYSTKSLAHIAFETAQHQGSIDFENGVINLNDLFLSGDILASNKPLHHHLNPSSTASFWLNVSIKPDKDKIYKFKNFSFEQDSLLKYYNGNLNFEWTNSITQTDSIITYEYNDDFEKVEKVGLRKRNIPSISINVGSKGNGLKNYLANQGLINLDSNLVNKNAFPLYKVFVNSSNENLNFATVKNQNTSTSNIVSTDFLYLNVDLIKLGKQLEAPFMTSYFKALKNLEVKGKLLDGKRVKIDGKLKLKDENINSLYQILKSL